MEAGARGRATPGDGTRRASRPLPVRAPAARACAPPQLRVDAASPNQGLGRVVSPPGASSGWDAAASNALSPSARSWHGGEAVGDEQLRQRRRLRRRGKTRFDFDGPAWFERQRTGYKGLAWQHLSATEAVESVREDREQSQKRRRRRPRGADAPREPRLRFSSLGSPGRDTPAWLNKHVEARMFGNLLDLAAQEASEAELGRFGSEPGHATAPQADEEAEAEAEVGKEMEVLPRSREQEHEDRLRAIILRKAQARRDRDRVQGRLKHGYCLEVTAELTADAYQLPRTLALIDARELAIEVQDQGVVRNWPLIKAGFDINGGVLALRALRAVLLRAGLSVPHAGRVILRAATTLQSGEDLVAYDDLLNLYFSAEDAYETDSELEDMLLLNEEQPVAEITSEEEQDLAQGEQDQGQEQSELGDERVAATELVEAAPSAPVPRVQERYQWRRNSVLDDAALSPEEKYARKVLRLRRKVRAAVEVKGVPLGAAGVTADALVDALGSSVTALKRIDREWLRPKPVRKRSVLLGSAHRKGAVAPVRSSFAFGSQRPGELPSAASEEVAHLIRAGRTTALQALPEQLSLLAAVTLLRSVAVVGMQARWRGVFVRNRARMYFEQAMVARAILARAIKLQVKWFKVSQRKQALAKYVRRRFVCWRGYVRLLNQRRRVFRLCFWPLYVWRRYTHRSITAREKAKMLKRVWFTLLLMRNFRAWAGMLTQSRTKMRQALRLLKGNQDRALAERFRFWRAQARQARRIKESWETRGKQLQAAQLRVRMISAWSLWRLWTRGSVTCRQRAARLYNWVPDDFVSRHRMYRLTLGLPQRCYDPYEAFGGLPQMPSYESMMGPVCTAFVQQKADMRRMCEGYHAQLVKVDRYGRITNCIIRNRLGPGVIAQWKAHVETAQKGRYAWHHYVSTLKRKAFGALRRSRPERTRHTFSTRRKRANSVETATRPTVLLPGSSPKGRRRQSSASATPGRVAGERRVAIAAGAPDRSRSKSVSAQGPKDRRRRSSMRQEGKPEQVDEPRKEETKEEVKARYQSQMLERREFLAVLQKERTESHTRWVKDDAWRTRGLEAAKGHAADLRRRRIGRAARLKAHEERLRLAREDAELSVSQTESMISAQALVLKERQRLQLEHAERLHGMRARMLHDALFHVIDEVETERMRDLMRQCLRMLRLPVVVKKSFGMMMRKRLQNYVRICVRLRKLWRAMPKFHLLKVKWQTFNKWLAFLDDGYQFTTPGLADELRERLRRLRAYSGRIRAVGEEALHGTQESWFLRWVEFAQCAATRRQIVRLSRARARLFTLRRFLSAWRTHLRPRYDFETRATTEPFLAQRLRYDLDRIKSRVLFAERLLLTHKLRCREQHVRDGIRRSVRGQDKEHLLLKKVLAQHARHARARLELEGRLLCTAFEERGTFSFQDTLTDTAGLQANGVDGGRPFLEPAVAASVFVHSVLVAISDGMVVALQLKMRSGSLSAPRYWTQPAHGAWQQDAADGDESGGGGGAEGRRAELTTRPGRTVHEFVLQGIHEKLEAIEGFALDNVVGGKIRFRTTSGRVSPWYGYGESGQRFILPRCREMSALGGLRFVEEFVVGLHGLESDSSILALGAVVRQVDQTNVFSHCWLDRVTSMLDDVPDAQSSAEQYRFIQAQTAAHEQQFNTVLAMRCADVETALRRAGRLAQLLRHADGTPEPLRNMRVVSGMMRWLFNSLSRHLVPLPDGVDIGARDDDRAIPAGIGERAAAAANGNIARGYMMIQQGNERLRDAQVEERNLRALLYRSGGREALNEAHIGVERYRAIATKLERNAQALQAARRQVVEGRAVVDSGLLAMPKLDTSARALQYYANLVRLATIKEQLLE